MITTLTAGCRAGLQPAASFGLDRALPRGLTETFTVAAGARGPLAAARSQTAGRS